MSHVTRGSARRLTCPYRPKGLHTPVAYRPTRTPRKQPRRLRQPAARSLVPLPSRVQECHRTCGLAATASEAGIQFASPAPTGGPAGMEHELPGWVVRVRLLSVPCPPPDLTSCITCARSDSDAVSDDDTDEELQLARGRADSQRALENVAKRNTRSNAEPHAISGKPPGKTHRESSVSHSGSSRRNSPTRAPERMLFTRSRSPAVHLLGNGFRPASPAVGARPKQSLPVRSRALLPATFNLTFPVPLSKYRWMVSIDVRQAAENLLLLCSLGYCADKIRAVAGEPFSPDMWISIGMMLLFVAPRGSTLTSCCRTVLIDHRINNLLLYNTPSLVESNHVRSNGFYSTRPTSVTAQLRKQARGARRNCQPKQERGEGILVDDRTEELQVSFARFPASAQCRSSLEHPEILQTMAS